MLVACAAEGGSSGGAPATPTSSVPPTSSSSPSRDTSPAPTTPAGAEPLVPVADVPVGGGVVLAAAGVVVTQPRRGEFRGFSATCPHAEVVLSEVTADDIYCGDGHGSRFALEDGAVLTGPATSPLSEVPVTVRNNQVVRT